MLLATEPSARRNHAARAYDLRTGRYWWYGTFLGAAIVYGVLLQLGAQHWPRIAVAIPVVVGGGIAGVVTGMYAETIERTVRNITAGMLAIAVIAWLFHLL